MARSDASRLRDPSPPAPVRPGAEVGASGVRGLAKATGVSVATISRVLNGAGNVAPDTRARVEAAIAAAGYQPNPAARALSTRRSRTIGAVIPTLAHSIFATFLRAVEEELAGHGYALVIATTGGDLEREAQRARALIDLGAEGLIVSGIERAAGFEQLLAGGRIPVVATSFFDPRNPIPTIGYDNRALGRDAFRHLRALGHREVAVLHGPCAVSDRTRARIAGVRSAARGCRVSYFECELDAVGGASAAASALALRPRCTAILCLSDVLALGAVFEARRAGLQVPSQLSIMGFDDLDWAAVCDPPLTTLHLPAAENGALAARALVRCLDDGIQIQPLALGAAVVTRSSTGPAPG